MASSSSPLLQRKEVRIDYLLEKITERINLFYLLVELCGMVVYFVVFTVFVTYQSSSVEVSQQNFAMRSALEDALFPSATLEPIRFMDIASFTDWLNWYSQVGFVFVASQSLGGLNLTDAIRSAAPTHMPGFPSPTEAPFTFSPTLPTSSPSPPPSSVPSLSPIVGTHWPTTLAPAPTQAPTELPTVPPSTQPTKLPTRLPTPANLTPAPTPDTRTPTSNAPSASPSARIQRDEQSRLRPMFNVPAAYLRQIKLKTNLEDPSIACPNAPKFAYPILQPPRPTGNGYDGNSLCVPPYSAEYVTNFWSGVFQPGTIFAECGSKWTFQEASPLGETDFVGETYTSYAPKGNYLRVNLTDFMDPLGFFCIANNPSQTHPIPNRETRLLALSGLLFSPTNRLWSYFALYLESFPSGTVVPSTEYMTAPLDSLYTEEPVEFAFAIMTFICILLHFIWTAYNAMAILLISCGATSDDSNSVRMDTTERNRVLLGNTVLNVWFWVNLAFIGISITILVYIGAVYLSGSWKDVLNASPYTPSTYQNILSYISRYNVAQQVFGVQYLLFNIQVFKYFPALPCFAIIRKVSSLLASDLALLFCMYFTGMIAFGLAGWWIYGDTMFEYRTFPDAFITILRYILGDPDFSYLYLSDSVFTWFFLLAYLFFFTYMLMALFISVFIEGFRAAFVGNLRKNMGLTHYLATTARACAEEPGSCFRAAGSSGANWKFAGLSPEDVYRRIVQWKNKRANLGKDYISWEETKLAIKGSVYNQYDVTDEEVNMLFRALGAGHVRDRKVVVAAAAAGSDAGAGSAKTAAAAHTPKHAKDLGAIVNDVMTIKADEQLLIRQLGQTVKELAELEQKGRRLAENTTNVFIE